MPLELQIIRASEFVRLGARGHLDMEGTKEALRELARACRKRGLDRALLDLRELPIPAKPFFTPSQLASLVGTFPKPGLHGASASQFCIEAIPIMGRDCSRSSAHSEAGKCGPSRNSKKHCFGFRRRKCTHAT